MITNKELKYEYLFNKDNVLTHFSEAIRLNEYRLYPNMPLDYIYKAGEERQYFVSKIKSGGSNGESAEHYNAKMKIVHELKYYDTIFNEWVYFYKAVPEQTQENKRPDISCYDKNNNLVCCIEIHNTNAKSQEDIEILKNLKTAVIEIDINYGNKCKHLILPNVLESNKREFETITKSIESNRIRYSEYKNKCEESLQRVKREWFGDITVRINSIKSEIEKETTSRIKKITNWLQERYTKLERVEREIFENERDFEQYEKIVLAKTEREKCELYSTQQITEFENEYSKLKSEYSNVKAEVDNLEPTYRSMEETVMNDHYGYVKQAQERNKRYFKQQ